MTQKLADLFQVERPIKDHYTISAGKLDRIGNYKIISSNCDAKNIHSHSNLVETILSFSRGLFRI